MLAKPGFEKRFREFALSGDSARLPTIYELARKFDVPRLWIQTIVRQLRDEGVLKVSRRGGITLKRFENHPAAQPLLSREDALYRLVRSRIESGAYRLGQPLPKTGLIAKSERVCTANVGHVYRRLVTERLVSRVGRTFIVGPGGLHGYPQSSHQGKCVLMIELSEFTEEDILLPAWIMPFAQSFMREMSLYGVEPRTAFISRSSTRKTPWPIPAGKSAIGKLIDDLGGRLLGTLVICIGSQVGLRYGLSMFSFLEWLCRFEKPVVYFDSPDDAGADSRRPRAHQYYRRLVAGPLMQEHFFRCYPDYDRSESLPVEALSELGHRIAGYCDLGRSSLWLRLRQLKIVNAAAELSPPLRIVSSRECPPLFTLRPDLRSHEFAEDIRRFFPGRIVRNINAAFAAIGSDQWVFSDLPEKYKSLVHLTSHLGALVTHPGLTALVAPADRHAKLYYRWLQTAGIKVPQELSLISFDDRQERLYPYSISSVNFGLDELGYSAFHLLLGDSPLKPDALRSVKSRCRINHLATMGTPGRRRV